MDGALPPMLDVDLFSEQEILNPYPTYDRLRDLGPAVLVPRLNIWAITRYKAAKAVLRNPTVFSSDRGVTANDAINDTFLAGGTLTTEGSLHDRQKKVMVAPLSPTGLDSVRERIRLAADDLVDGLPLNTPLDAVAEISRYLPLTIVSNLVGIPEEGRGRMLDWAAAVFNMFGPDNERSRDCMPTLHEVLDFVMNKAKRDCLAEGGWGAMAYAAADRGEINHAQAQGIMLDYLLPSLDTTISATSSLIRLFGENPEQWRLLRQKPELVSKAINEAVRLESPIRGFTRYVNHDHQIEGGPLLAAGARVLVLFGAANRDPDHYPDPSSFRIERPQADHLGFGFGSHACAGMHLARLEMSCLLKALLRRVDHFEIHSETVVVNNALRALGELSVTLH